MSLWQIGIELERKNCLKKVIATQRQIAARIGLSQQSVHKILKKNKLLDLVIDKKNSWKERKTTCHTVLRQVQ